MKPSVHQRLDRLRQFEKRIREWRQARFFERRAFDNSEGWDPTASMDLNAIPVASAIIGKTLSLEFQRVQFPEHVPLMTSVFRAALVLSTILLLAVTAPIGGAAPQANQDTTNQGTRSPAARAIGQKLLEKGVPNFGKVTPTLYRGGLPNDAGFKALARMGVQIVVDLHAASSSEEKEVQKLGMQYVTIPWHCPSPKDEVFAKFLRLLRENRGKKVFVHCRLGDDRTGMMTAAYRIAEEGWTANEAMEEMKAFGFSRVHHLMCPGLADYEKQFPDRLKSSPALEEARAKQ